MSESADAPAAAPSSGAFVESARDVLWFAALAGVLLILLHESLFFGKGLGPADGILNCPPWNRATRLSNTLLSDQSLVLMPTQEFVHRQKSFPLWNPYLCCGAPHLGVIAEAPLFPISWLFSWLDPFAASGPRAFLKLFLAGYFTLLFVRLLGASRAGAFLAGLVFSLSGFMIVWLGHPHVNSAMWLPALLYFLEKSFRTGPGNALAASALRAWAGFAVAFAFMILGGHVPTMIHVALVPVIYFLFRLREDGGDQVWPRAGLLTGAIALGFLLAAPQILPYLEYYRQSSSALATASLERASHHLTVASLLHFLLPNALGNPAVGFEDMPSLLKWPEADNFNEITGYVGILPLFFAAWGIAPWRRPFAKFFFFLALGSMLIICGVPPFPVLLQALPLFRDVSWTRLLLIVGFCVAVLAGLGWDEFWRTRTRRRTLLITVGFWAIVGGVLLWFWHGAAPALHILDQAHRAFLGRQILILCAGMIFILFSALWPAGWIGRGPMAICLIWTAVDLLCFGMGYNPALPRDLCYPTTPAIEWLQQDHSLFRVFGPATMLAPNAAEAYGLSDARGCDYMNVRRYEELVTGHAGDFYFYWYPKEIPATLPLLNVKYILSATNSPLNPLFYELVYSKEICIYRFKKYQERALVVFDHQVLPDRAAVLDRVSSPNFDPGQILLLEHQPGLARTAAGGQTATTNADRSARILSYEPDEIRIGASLARPGYLLLLDTYFPGWSATVNGEPTTILRADYNFRAVQLPAGVSTVSFSYRPQSLRIGLYLCAVGLLAIAVVWCLPRR